MSDIKRSFLVAVEIPLKHSIAAEMSSPAPDEKSVSPDRARKRSLDSSDDIHAAADGPGRRRPDKRRGAKRRPKPVEFVEHDEFRDPGFSSDDAWAAHASSTDGGWHSTDEDTSALRIIASASPPAMTSFNGKLDHFAFAGSPPSRSTSDKPKTATPPARRPARSTTASARDHTTIPSASPNSQSTPPRSKRNRTRQQVTPLNDNAHLPGLVDSFCDNLLVLFVGVNPGIKSGTLGYPYAHPSNSFWKCLHKSGITPRLCLPKEHVDLPALYRIGNTNLVARSTVSQANLMRGEMEQKVDLLEEKLRQWKPEVVCLVGKGPWDSVYKAKHGRAQRREHFNFGFQDERENLGRTSDWGGSRVFVSSSTSGLASVPKPDEKVAIWKQLGDWVVQRRADIAAEGAAVSLMVDDVVASKSS